MVKILGTVINTAIEHCHLQWIYLSNILNNADFPSYISLPEGTSKFKWLVVWNHLFLPYFGDGTIYRVIFSEGLKPQQINLTSNNKINHHHHHRPQNDNRYHGRHLSSSSP